MTGTRPLGPLVHSFFIDHLITVKGLRPASVRSYRDTVRLFLCFVADRKGTKITRLELEDLTFERVLGVPASPGGRARQPASAPATSGWPPCTRCSTTSPHASRRCSASASGWPPSR